ncbi:hypothetical protein C0J52_23705 [Blattella germanica]|nr:hypothetical protein C0J52_23705 [Blattella germanica]
MSGLSIVVFCVANLVQFYTHRDFVPSSVSSPVLLLAFAGIAACCVAAMGWYGAMTGNTCRIFGFSVLLLMVVIVEFGASIWCLTSRADFHDTMAGSMEASFSAYKKDEAVVKKWDFLQRELECCGTDGPEDYRRLGAVSWACCASETEKHGSCELMRQRGCLTALSIDVRSRLLWLALFGIVTSLMQISGVFCSCCLKNSLQNEERRNKILKRSSMELKSRTSMDTKS